MPFSVKAPPMYGSRNTSGRRRRRGRQHASIAIATASSQRSPASTALTRRPNVRCLLDRQSFDARCNAPPRWSFRRFPTLGRVDCQSNDSSDMKPEMHRLLASLHASLVLLTACAGGIASAQKCHGSRRSRRASATRPSIGACRTVSPSRATLSRSISVERSSASSPPAVSPRSKPWNRSPRRFRCRCRQCQLF